MKNIVLCLALGINCCVFSYSQIYYTTGPDVYTCKNGIVATIKPNRELNSQELANIDYALFNPNGTYYSLGIKTSDIILSPSSYYNCHAYAWHLTDGNSNKVWINEGTNASNLKTYWSSNYGCFVECAESEAEKIHYYNGDHSAVKSSVAGKYESKWGAWYLLRHNPTQVPYASPNNRKYYRRCVDDFSNKPPITTNTTIFGCNTLNIQNVTISNYATVTISAKQSVTLGPGFHATTVSNVHIFISPPPPGMSSVSDIEIPSGEDEVYLEEIVSSLEKISNIQLTNEIDFIVYPNPANGDFRIKITGNLQPYTVELFNSSGNMLGRTSCDMETINVNRNDLPGGIYFVKLSMGSNTVVKKLIIQ